MSGRMSDGSDTMEIMEGIINQSLTTINTQQARITELEHALTRIARPGEGDSGKSAKRMTLYACEAKIIARGALGLVWHPEAEDEQDEATRAWVGSSNQKSPT